MESDDDESTAPRKRARLYERDDDREPSSWRRGTPEMQAFVLGLVQGSRPLVLLNAETLPPHAQDEAVEHMEVLCARLAKAFARVKTPRERFPNAHQFPQLSERIGSLVAQNSKAGKQLDRMEKECRALEREIEEIEAATDLRENERLALSASARKTLGVQREDEVATHLLPDGMRPVRNSHGAPSGAPSGAEAGGDALLAAIEGVRAM